MSKAVPILIVGEPAAGKTVLSRLLSLFVQSAVVVDDVGGRAGLAAVESALQRERPVVVTATDEMAKTLREHVPFAVEIQIKGPFGALVMGHHGGAAARALLACISERRGQRMREGYDDAHDAAHVNGELAVAAACYARPPSGRFLQVRAYGPDLGVGRATGERAIAMVPPTWPWEVELWKPSPDNRKREVEKAVGLLLAEWERLDGLEQLKAGAGA